MGAERAQSGRRAGAERVQSGRRAGAEGACVGMRRGRGEGAERVGRGGRRNARARRRGCSGNKLQPYALEAATLRGVPERDAVDAVALARGHRTVGESVA